MRSKKLLAAAIVTSLSAGLIGAGAGAVPATDTAAPTQAAATDNSPAENAKADQDLVKVSRDAMLTMRDLRGARLAIFNGEPERARTFADAAVTRIGAALGAADDYAVQTKEAKSGETYIPFNASLTVLDAYKATNAKAIAKANEHLDKGKQKEALETLKLSEVDLAVSAWMIPVKFAQEHITDAAQLIGEGKYYEANLALKAVDDAVVMQDFELVGKPQTKDADKADTKQD